MKKILILTEHYPSKNYIYNYMFIHSRATEYVKHGYIVKVLFLSLDEYEYEYENITVLKGSFQKYKNQLIDFSPDVIFTHTPRKLLISQIEDIKKTLKVKNFTWIHGVEALSVYRRIFNVTSVVELLKLFTKGLIDEIRRKVQFNKYKLICDKYGDEFIFVSKWMKEITENDNFTKINKFRIIPNFIDNFKFSSESVRSNKSFLIVRSFESKKYANDISIKILNRLYEVRDDFHVTIIGDGALFDDELKKLVLPKKCVKVEKRMLERSEMSTVFNSPKYGFFLCPTRQDAQGVTMCEAMASGLVVVTNPSTAIPEFVSKDYAIMESKVNDVVDQLCRLMDDKIKFEEKSKNAKKYISSNLSSDCCIQKELKLIKFS